jgi:hypothetical protein
MIARVTVSFAVSDNELAKIDRWRAKQGTPLPTRTACIRFFLGRGGFDVEELPLPKGKKT